MGLSPERMEQLKTALRRNPRVEVLAPIIAEWVVVPEELVAIHNRVIAERNEAKAELYHLRGQIAVTREELRRLPVWGPDERGLMILDGVDQEGLLARFDTLIPASDGS